MNRSSSRFFPAGVVLVVLAVLAVALGGRQPRRPGSAGLRSDGGEPNQAAGAPTPPLTPAGARAPATASPARHPSAAVQEDPEVVDPALRREHDRLLEDRPTFQHLPYRDTEIGVGFDRVVGGGKLELLVTYLGPRSRAVRDVHRLFDRYDDPGTAYVERYERVF